MNATMTSDAIPVRPAPRSRRTIRLEEGGRRSRGLSYAAVAVLLILAMIGGVLFANRGGSGGNRFDDLRYAAQPVSPEASAVVAQGCDVEALTVDEVMAIVENPYANLDYQRLNVAGIPDFLTEGGEALILPQGHGSQMEPESKADARSVVTEYLRCRESGTLGQVFAYLSPNMIRQHVLEPFPTFRGEDEVRAYVEAVLTLPARNILYHPAFEMNVTVAPATGEDTALTFSLHPDYQVAWIGTEGIDEAGNVVAVSDAYDMLVKGQDLPGPNRTFGAISVIQYPGVDRWFVHDREVTFSSGQATLSGNSSSETCPVEPVTTDEMLELLRDPNRYAAEKLGAGQMAPEGEEVIEAIRDEPESLVLASVTSDSETAMLVLPQEGVQPAAGLYLDCWQNGSAGQAFALMAPHMVAEYDDLVALPRDVGKLQEMLDAPARELPVSDRVMPTFVLDDGRAITLADPQDPYGYVSLPGGFEVVFVGTYLRDSSGTPILGANIDDRSRVWTDESVNVNSRMSFGALTLIKYPGTDEWLVYDHWIELEPTPMSLP